MEKVFQIVAAVLAGIAVFFLYQGNKDAAFITVVFGCASFFFSIRTQAKKRVEKENAEIIEEKYGKKDELFPDSDDEDFISAIENESDVEKIEN